MHDPTRVLLGTTTSSAKDISNFAADPATFAAGFAVRATAAGGLSLAAAGAGMFAGVSVGRSLSDTKRTAVVRTGERVPIRLTAAFTPTVGAPVHVSDTTGLAIAAGAGATITAATYVSGVLTGQQLEGADVPVALIDMPGGL